MKLLLLVLAILLSSFISVQPRVAPADTVFRNGNVYTANDKTPQTQAIAVKADRIVFVGTNANAQQMSHNPRSVRFQCATSSNPGKDQTRTAASLAVAAYLPSLETARARPSWPLGTVASGAASPGCRLC